MKGPSKVRVCGNVNRFSGNSEDSAFAFQGKLDSFAHGLRGHPHIVVDKDKSRITI